MKQFNPTELSQSEKEALLSLTYYPGWAVLRKLMEKRVQNATVRMLDVKPDDPKRAELISNLQADAFAKDSFCQELFQDVNWNIQSLAEEDEAEPESPGLAKAMEAARKLGILKEA
jgi:hypothetical protein